MKRPIPITIVCILGFLGMIVLVVSWISTGSVNSVPGAILKIVGCVAFFGLWKMKKWGIYLWFGSYIVSSALALLNFFPDMELYQDNPWILLIGPILFGLATLPYWKRFA